MSTYATIEDVKNFGALPGEDIEEIEGKYPGVTGQLITHWSGEFEAKLIKRYPAAFDPPYPIALTGKISQVVAYRMWLKRGGYPEGELYAVLKDDYDKALTWLDEAANGQTGLIELQKRDGPLGISAIGSGGPLGYSETSPYVAFDVQVDIARFEDRNRGGS